MRHLLKVQKSGWTAPQANTAMPPFNPVRRAYRLLDANVIAGALPRNILLSLAEAGLFRPRWPVRFEITEQTRESVSAYLASNKRKSVNWLFPGRRGKPMTTRQYARLLDRWLAEIGLEPALFGTHSLRRTKATLIYRRTGNLRALLLGNVKIESTVRHLGVEVDDAFTTTEQADV